MRGGSRHAQLLFLASTHCFSCINHAPAEQKELALNDETRKQNELLDQIHMGLGDLLNGAKVGCDCSAFARCAQNGVTRNGGCRNWAARQ